MKLVLAEKPSVAQSIAKVLGAAKREDGYLEGNGYVVSWCVGHLVELAQPEVYDAKYSKWAYADLPIFPMDWQYEVSAGTKKQFGILKKLMAREDVASLVCATDAGREGELIFRLVYHKAGCRKPFERLWISSMEDVAIKEGFENLRSGTEYDALYTEAKKKDLFAKVRTGQVRVLLGSTQKMGAGTNVQDKLVAVHHLDVGWRPSDMTQRNGRIIRQGNRNKEVQVYQYVTEGTFDAYLYQTLENKQKFISQIMTSKSPVRSCDDVDEQALSYAEIKALCAGNPLIKEKMDLDIDVARLKVLKADHQSQQYRMEDKLLKYFPAEIEKQTGYIHGFEADIKTVEAHPQIADGFCGMEIMGKAYTEKADAGEILLAACKDTKSADPVPLGSYRGFQMELSFDSFRNEFDVTLKGAVSHRVALGTDARGNITRLDNALAGILERLERANEQLNNLYNQQEAAKAEVGKPFPQEAELTAKSQRLAELDAALNMEDSVENRDERSESERPSVLADLKSKAEHIPPAKYSETREEVL